MLPHRPALRASASSLALFTLSLSTILPAQAQSSTPDSLSASTPNNSAGTAASDAQWSLGLGGGITRSPYRGYGNQNSALPLLLYDSQRLHFFGTSTDLKLGSLQQFDFTLRAQYSGDGYQSNDATILNNMAERKYALWLGGTATWRAPWARLTAQWLKDASGHSRGQTFRLNAEHGFTLGRVILTPHLGVAWYDKNYVDYYYGVRQDEANASRNAYTGKATVNTSIGLRTGWRFSAAQSVFLDASATHLGSGISDSPLVDRATLPSVRLGYLYQF
jgi:outer membrane protein